MNNSVINSDEGHYKNKLKGRMLLIGLVLVFALPAILAKTILSNNWYQSGVTNFGNLVEPIVTFESLDIDNPLFQKSWQMGLVMPKECLSRCVEKLHLLRQTRIALGKNKERILPVVYVTAELSVIPTIMEEFIVVPVSEEFLSHVSEGDYLVVDPLGQLVMSYPNEQEITLAAQSKGLLSDLRKLLKLSRVG
jgi:hypothetical protein